MHFTDVVGAEIHLVLYFANNLANTVELIVIGERISSIAIDTEDQLLKMDNQKFFYVVNRFPLLNFKYLASFPADLWPRDLPTNTFCIINTDPSTRPGSHWILLASKNGKLFYGDSMGEVLGKNGSKTKSKFGSLVHEKLQGTELCGLYAIYIAHVLFSKVSSKY